MLFRGKNLQVILSLDCGAGNETRAKHWPSSAKIKRKHADARGSGGMLPPEFFYMYVLRSLFSHSGPKPEPHSVNILLWKTWYVENSHEFIIKK